MDNYAKAILKRKTNRIIDRKGLSNKKIVLFGASVASKEVKTCLLERGITIDAIIDNDSRKIGKGCMGLTVQIPEDVLTPFDNETAILVISGGFYREIVLQLSQMGYKKNKHIFILNFKTNESLPVMAYMGARVIRGKYTYRRLTKGLPRDSILFIAPYTGMGDIYLAGLYFNEYIRRNDISEYVFAVVNGACKKVAEIFNIKNIVVVKPQIIDDVINYKNFIRSELPVVVLNDGWGGDPLQWIRGYKNLSFDKMFRNFVFGFDDDVEYELPPRKEHEDEIDALFLKHGLKKGKTVVLSPYSNTLFELPDKFWQTIAEQYKQLGYSVCTNCSGAAEKPVEGTQAVFFQLGQAIDFMNAAGYFIGVRSGLCDIISSSSCKKIILYEKDGFFYKCSPFEYFSLKKMGLCNDAIEIEYQPGIENVY